MNRVSLFSLCVLSFVSSLFADPRTWDQTGVTLRQTYNLDWTSAVASRDNGDHIVVWSDARSGNREIYGQYVMADGSNAWDSEGVRLVSMPSSQTNPEVCMAEDGFLVAWLDARVYEDASAIWLQKFDFGGHAMWPDNGGRGLLIAETTSGIRVEFSIESDLSGGAYVVYRAHIPSSFLAQRILGNGQAAWDNAVVIADSTLISWEINSFSSVADPAGNVLVAWSDRRSGDDTDIYATKIMADGTLPWGGVNGIPVCRADNGQSNVQLGSDGGGRCAVIWEDRRDPLQIDIYAQRISADGQLLWNTDGVPLTSGLRDQRQPSLSASFVGTTLDGFIATWLDARDNGYGEEVFAQKLSLDGNSQWAANGVLVCGSDDPNSNSAAWQPSVLSDRAGGMLCSWITQNNDQGAVLSVSAARLLADGVPAWSETCGVLLSDFRENWPETRTFLSSGLGGDPVVFWTDRSASVQAVKTQRLAMNTGQEILEPEGRVLFSCIHGGAENPRVFSMEAGRVITFWGDSRDEFNSWSIYYQILNSNGEALLAEQGVPLCNGNAQWNANDIVEACADGQGGVFVVWREVYGSTTVRLQHISRDGVRLLAPEGVEVWAPEPPTHDQDYPRCQPDGAGGVYVAWRQFDERFYTVTLVRRFDATGQALWAEPMRFTHSDYDVALQDIAVLSSGDVAVMNLIGPFSNYQASLTLLSGSGATLWTAIAADSISGVCHLVVDNADRIFVSWLQHAEGQASDVRSQLYSGSGERLWSESGVALISSQTGQSTAATFVGTTNNFWVLSVDDWGGGHLNAQRVDAEGQLAFDSEGLRIANGRLYSSTVKAVHDGMNGVMAVWLANVGDVWPYSSGVFGTHIDASGQVVDDYWNLDQGGLIGGLDIGYPIPSLALDGAGGAVCVWQDVVYKEPGGESFDPIYRIKAQRIDDGHITSADEVLPLPFGFALNQNFPNPFNPTTEISYTLPALTRVNLSVYDITGRLVAELVDQVQAAGTHVSTFDASNVASGVYFYRIDAGQFVSTKKMVVLK